jgi:hypothetical protein
MKLLTGCMKDGDQKGQMHDFGGSESKQPATLWRKTHADAGPKRTAGTCPGGGKRLPVQTGIETLIDTGRTGFPGEKITRMVSDNIRMALQE